MMSPAATPYTQTDLETYQVLQQPPVNLTTWFPQSNVVPPLHKPLKTYPVTVPYASTNRPSGPAVVSCQPNGHCPATAHESAGPATTTQTVSKKTKTRKWSKSNYKHVPHRDKPPHLVARRNARERRRVQAVNSAFARLRKCVPVETRGKRLSKVKTLHRAIEYINCLQSLLSETNEDGSAPLPPHFDLASPDSRELYRASSLHGDSVTSPDEDDDIVDEEDDDYEGDEDSGEVFADAGRNYLSSEERNVNKENESGQHWITMTTNCETDYEAYAPYYDEYSRGLTS